MRRRQKEGEAKEEEEAVLNSRPSVYDPHDTFAVFQLPIRVLSLNIDHYTPYVLIYIYMHIHNLNFEK